MSWCPVHNYGPYSSDGTVARTCPHQLFRRRVGVGPARHQRLDQVGARRHRPVGVLAQPVEEDLAQLVAGPPERALMLERRSSGRLLAMAPDRLAQLLDTPSARR